MRRLSLYLLTLSVLQVPFMLGAIAAPGTPVAGGPKPSTMPEPKMFGRLHDMMSGNSEAHVALSDLTNDHLYALGALSELRGEVTILDGVAWLAYPDGKGGVRVTVKKAADEKATTLVASNVPRWQRVTLEENVPFSAIDAKVESLAKAHGIDITQAFPLLIEGQLEDVHWHVVDGSRLTPGHHSHADHAKAGVSTVKDKVDGQLLGFFSTHHQGVFTHMGANTHFHIVVPKEKLSGHVDSVGLKKGDFILFPAAG